MCKVEWCNNKPNQSGKGYCRRHYDQMRKQGFISEERTIHSPNDIVIKNNYAEMILRNRKGEEVATVKIDIDDIELVKKHKWSLHSGGYVRTKVDRNGKQHTLYLHRYLTGISDSMEIDHINRDKLDNRKSNLRECSHNQNCFNRASKYKGVNKITDRQLTKPYYATIGAQGEKIHLGFYHTYEEALQVRLEAEEVYHGEFKFA